MCHFVPGLLVPVTYSCSPNDSETHYGSCSLDEETAAQVSGLAPQHGFGGVRV